MQKQTTHFNFDPSNMKDYAYAVAAELNNLIDGKAEPMYDHVGVWHIMIMFNKVDIKFNKDLCKCFYYKICPSIAANMMVESIIKEITNYVFKGEKK